MSASVVIAIEKKKDFLQNIPAGWKVDQHVNKITCQDNSVTVLSHDKEFTARDNFFEVTTIEELNIVRELIRSRPVLTTVKCSKSYNDRPERDQSSENDNSETVTDDYIVLINTAHPQMVDMFNKAFEQAEENLKEGKNFRITIAINKSLQIWYLQNKKVNGELKNTTWANFADIYLTCGTKEPTCADTCFSCQETIQKVLWCVCFPLFFLLVLPYWIYKRFVLGVIESKIEQPVPITYHENPFPMGFNIMNLLYPPGSTFTTITTYHQQPPPASLQQQTFYQPGYQPQPTGYQLPPGYDQPQPGYQQQPGYPTQSVNLSQHQPLNEQNQLLTRY